MKILFSYVNPFQIVFLCVFFFVDFLTIFVCVEVSSSRSAKIKVQGHLLKFLICVRNISEK